MPSFLQMSSIFMPASACLSALTICSSVYPLFRMSPILHGWAHVSPGPLSGGKVTEGGHQVATVDMAVPEQPELDELESALDAPPDAALHCSHLRTPGVRSASKRDSTSFWAACKVRRAGADVDHRLEEEGGGAVSGAWYFSVFL